MKVLNPKGFCELNTKKRHSVLLLRRRGAFFV